MVELEQTIRRQKDEHADELARERGTTHEEIRMKEKEVETATRALAMTRRQLQQTEDTINEFMENPTADPTTDVAKDALILKLKAEIKELKRNAC